MFALDVYPHSIYFLMNIWLFSTFWLFSFLLRMDNTLISLSQNPILIEKLRSFIHYINMQYSLKGKTS